MAELAGYRVLDALFVVLHSALIAFNMAGWAWRRTRRAHLAAVGATMASWVVLGAFRGWGYCPLTDWHWRVKAALGETALPGSWVKYHLDLLTGMDWSPRLVDGMVVGVAVAALGLSAALNLRDRALDLRTGGGGRRATRGRREGPS